MTQTEANKTKSLGDKEASSDSVKATGRNAHTPGPWSAEGLSGTAGDYSITIRATRTDEIGNRSSRYIAEVQSSRLPDQLEADARLIAAAPELLEALTGLYEFCKDLRYSPKSKMAMKIARAEAAFAKAECRQ
jgi:hypothetical protein